MSILNQTQKDIIKKYLIDRDIKLFYSHYRNIIFKNLSLPTGNKIIAAMFKSKDMSLES